MTSVNNPQDNLQDSVQDNVQDNLQSNVQTPVSTSTSTSSSSSTNSLVDESNITTVEKPKEKDPKRVAAGKRLAAISKAAKEKKMRDMIENESSSTWKHCVMISLGLSVFGYFVYRRFKPEKRKVSFNENDEEIRNVHDLKPVYKTMNSLKLPRPKTSRGKPISMFD